MTVRLCARSSDGILVFGERVDEFSDTWQDLDRHVDNVIIVERVLVNVHTHGRLVGVDAVRFLLVSVQGRHGGQDWDGMSRGIAARLRRGCG